MNRKQKKPLDVYIKLGAISKIANEVLCNMVVGYSEIFTKTEVAKINRAINYLDESRCLADDKLFQEHPNIQNDGTRIFYGQLSTDRDTDISKAVDYEVVSYLLELLHRANVPYEFKRILEILDDYWLSVSDEYHVSVDMKFIKADGQHQEKNIEWCNEEYETPKLIKQRAEYSLKQTKSFYDYLIATHYGEESAVGDLASDMRFDVVNILVFDAIHCTQRPMLSSNPYEDIKGYLRERGACKECLSAFETVWKEYSDYISRTTKKGA